MTFLKQNALSMIVFVTGGCVLIVEIVATRILSPYYGNTIFTVSSVITIILAALSIGYYSGGRMADRYPSQEWFYRLILLSGLSLLIFQSIGSVALPIVADTLPITTGPLVSALALFFLPAVLMGMLSPYAIKLQTLITPQAGVGTVAGKIFFWSTAGSIIGSLLAGFVFIPRIGIQQIILSTALLLILLGLLPLLRLDMRRARIWFFVCLFVTTIAITMYSAQHASANVLYNNDGVYERLLVYDGDYHGRPTRFFQQDRSSSAAMFLDSDDLVYDYTKYYALYKLFTPNVKNALVIGGGAYSIPKALLSDIPNAHVDVAEIEPALYDLAQQYFKLAPSPRLTNYIEDGRRFLRRNDKRYDLIFSDVYQSLYSIPDHFTTQEFFVIAKSRLQPGGMFIANLIGDLSRQQPSFLLSEIRTFQTVFPNSYVFAVTDPGSVQPQNVMVVGYNSDQKIDVNSPTIRNSSNVIIRDLGSKRVDMDRFELSPYPILKDNFAPVESMIAAVLQRTIKKSVGSDGQEMMELIAQQLRYGPRYLTSSGHKQEQQFLSAELAALGARVSRQSWKHVDQQGRTQTLTNIIGRWEGEAERRILLATHYDSKRFADKDPRRPDQPVPGANDSASGVAVLLEVARSLKNASVKPAVGIDIVFFDAEEGEESQAGDYTHWKPLGSTYFAEHVSELYSTQKPIGGIVVDMVCDKDFRLYREASSMRSAPGAVEKFWSIGNRTSPRVFDDVMGPEIQDDHTALTSAGIPSFLVIDLDYPAFHTTRDAIDQCRGESLKVVADTTIDYLYAQQ